MEPTPRPLGPPAAVPAEEAERRLQALEAGFRETYQARQADLSRLKEVGLRRGEVQNLTLLENVARRGVRAALRRRGPASADEVLDLIEQFNHYGPKAILLTGAQRGGDFLNNQLRGRWAERVVMSMNLEDLVLMPFGPSGAAMPGEEDHREVIMTFREIHLLEGKRPDLVAFERAVWEGLPRLRHERAQSWPKRLLEVDDQEILARARCGAEVKNSTWHYGKRREATGRALSITVKEEELADIEEWSRKTGLPVVFFQVLFDEVYSMSFRRMLEAIERGYLYAQGDYERLKQRESGKEVHHFYLADNRHRSALVTWPSETRGEVRILPDGNVVPYIDLQPAETTEAAEEVVLQEIEYGAS